MTAEYLSRGQGSAQKEGEGRDVNEEAEEEKKEELNGRGLGNKGGGGGGGGVGGLALSEVVAGRTFRSVSLWVGQKRTSRDTFVRGETNSPGGQLSKVRVCVCVCGNKPFKTTPLPC